MTTDGSPRRRRSPEDLAAVALDNPAAFGELFKRFRAYVRSEAHRYVPPGPRAPEGGSDLVQDVFAAAWQHARDFRGETDEELAAWLRTTLHHLALNKARSAPPAELSTDASGGAAFPDLPDPGQRPPDETLVEQERTETLRQAMQDLPTDYQAALDLRFGHGLSFAKIGRRLGRSGDAVRKMFKRAIRAVRRRVGGSEAWDG